MILLIVIQIITIQKINDYIELFCLIKKLVINKYRGSYMAKQYSIELIALGQSLSYLRSKTNLTYKEVGEKFGKSTSWMSDIEKGRNNILFIDAKKLMALYDSDLETLSKLYDVNLSQLKDSI